MRIRTRYGSNAHGAGCIVATTPGAQRTMHYRHELSPDANHEQAARELVASRFTDLPVESLTLLEQDGGLRVFEVVWGTRPRPAYVETAAADYQAARNDWTPRPAQNVESCGTCGRPVTYGAGEYVHTDGDNHGHHCLVVHVTQD
jgi:hypothetical protein